MAECTGRFDDEGDDDDLVARGEMGGVLAFFVVGCKYGGFAGAISSCVGAFCTVDMDGGEVYNCWRFTVLKVGYKQVASETTDGGVLRDGEIFKILKIMAKFLGGHE